ncbi:hypothetical protein [Haloprofundus salinisoli]|uniref:hypothetical protein n=1 Tax=Haloprofundus salinisoli TaxID=2876193 RepID=UPI001CCCDA86|nr:hypothetical protein [Haloprofundus salinisoli]
MNKMDGGIYLEQDGELVEMTEHSYPEEDVLQERLAEFPRLLAGNQMNPETPRNWALIAREAGIPDHEGGGGRWSADHLFIDQDAIPTLVEVKRASDTRIRREVVGQALDYISHACIHWDADTLETHFGQTWEQQGHDPDQVLGELLVDDSPSQFWEQAQSNLRAKRVRILFVADQIPSELKRVVEFLNEGFSDAEVFAVEVAQYKGEGMKAFVPRLYGQTEEARGTKKTSRYDGAIENEEEFFADIDSKLQQGKVTSKLAEAYRELYDFAQEQGNVQINRAQNASFKLLVDEHQGHAGGNPGVFSANINTNLQIWQASNPLPDEEGESSDVAWSREAYEEYQEAFSRLEGNLDGNTASIEIIALDGNLQQFKAACNEFVTRCKEATHTDERW